MTVKKIFETMEYGPAPESSKAAEQWLDKHDRKFGYFCNGKWEKPSTKKYFESVNPSDKSVLAEIAHAGEKDVNKAVKAAKKALPKWVALGAHGRARYLYALARQIQKNARLFSVLESMDNGKSIRETRDIDIPLVARHFYHHAGWAQLMDTELKDYKEVGVVGQIIPWNFPLLMLAWKIAPALAMGNTLVLKPAEFTSLTALLFAEICEQVGLPDGVVNIVTGYGDTGAAIVNHPDVDKVAFTGSTEVGRIIRRATAGTGKKLSLELGGKSPFIVFEDADLDSVVEGIVNAIWFNQGQVCCAGSRLLVQEGVAEKLYAKIKARMDKFRIGNALDKCIDMGAIVDATQLKTISSLVQKGIDEGGTVYQASCEKPAGGYYYPPTLFTGVSPSATIAQQEIFGPVLVAMTFRTHAEAIKLANNTRYGLAASIWTDNINMALEVAPKVKAGVVWVNCTNVFDAAAGFGGCRESGFGREGGREGLHEYTVPKINSLFAKKPFERKVSKETVELVKNTIPSIDRTAKMYIGGKQARPDGGYSSRVYSPVGQYVGDVSLGNRKDIRNAVEAAHAQGVWASKTGHARAQVLYYIAENMQARATELAQRIAVSLNVDMQLAEEEVQLSIERIYYYAALADKYDGRVHHTVAGNITIAMPESIGVVAVICPNEAPLLGFISTVIPAISMGNNVVVVPSETAPLLATDFYQILETSDVPAGTVNIVTGVQAELATVLAKHDDVDGIWYFGNQEVSQMIELESAENMKRSWVGNGKYRNWYEHAQGQSDEFLRRATDIKNIWVPYGE